MSFNNPCLFFRSKNPRFCLQTRFSTSFKFVTFFILPVPKSKSDCLPENIVYNAGRLSLHMFKVLCNIFSVYWLYECLWLDLLDIAYISMSLFSLQCWKIHRLSIESFILRVWNFKPLTQREVEEKKFRKLLTLCCKCFFRGKTFFLWLMMVELFTNLHNSYRNHLPHEFLLFQLL